MYYLLTSAFCATLLLLDPASAAPAQSQAQYLKVARVATGNIRVKSHGAAIKKAYGKYGIPLPEGFAPSSTQFATSNTSTGQIGSVTNSPTQQDAEFLAPITVGGQTIMMDFDTGSSDLWVFNTGLPANEAAGHTDFDPTQSTTFKAKKGSTFSVSYGDNSGAAGTVGTDTVNIGGATVTSQAVELATAVSQEFIQDTASNGLVGLAFSSLNTIKPAKQKTFFDNISPTLQEPVLTANLKHATPGAYEFGRIDSTQFSGALQWTAVDESSGFWQFPSSTFAVGNGSVQQNTQNSPAIADTGTSLLLVDQSVVNGYYSQVKGAVMSTQEGGVIFPCSSFLPDLKVAMGPDYMATISGDLLTFSQIGSATTNGNAKRGMKRAADTQYCFGALQSSAGNNIQIMGDVMFKSQFVAFNNGNNSVGFAPHAN